MIFLPLISAAVMAATNTHSVMIEVLPDGSRAFAFAGACADVKDAQMPLGRVDVVPDLNGIDHKLHVSVPKPRESNIKNRKTCLMECPKGSTPVPIGSATNFGKPVLACLAID